MSKKIRKAPLWMAARSNTKLPQDLYKKAVGFWKGKEGNRDIISFLDEKPPSISQFKRAYHSSLTKPEVRLMVLQKIFNPSYNFLSRFTRIDSATYKDIPQIGLRISKWKGEYYITLKGFNPFTGNYRNLTLSKPIRAEVRATTPVTVLSYRFLDALGAGDLKGMNAAIGLQNLNEYFLAMVDMIHWTNKKHNIWNALFWNSERSEYIQPTEDEREEFIKGQKTQRFIDDLMYMKNQFINIISTLEKLGVDTKGFLGTIDRVIEASIRFENIEKNTLVSSELFEAHKEWFKQVNSLSSLSVDVADQINSLSLENLSRKIGGRSVPKFVHFNPNRSNFMKTNNTYRELRDLDGETKQKIQYDVRPNWKLKRGDWPYY